MPRMRWVRLWTQETLYGTTNRELTLEERAIWFEMLALAGDSPTPGIICVSPNVSFTIAQLSQILGAPEELIRQAIVKLTSPPVNKIQTNGSGCLQIVNWERYQSEFDRTEYQREYMKAYRKRKTNGSKTNGSKSMQQNRREQKKTIPHPTPPSATVKRDFIYPEEWNELKRRNVEFLLSMPAFSLSAQKDGDEFVAGVNRWAERLGERSAEEVHDILYGFQEFWAAEEKRGHQMKRPFLSLTNWFFKAKASPFKEGK